MQATSDISLWRERREEIDRNESEVGSLQVACQVPASIFFVPNRIFRRSRRRPMFEARSLLSRPTITLRAMSTYWNGLPSLECGLPRKLELELILSVANWLTDFEFWRGG